MVIISLACLLATINAIVSGYYLVQGVQAKPEEGSKAGSFIFSGVAGVTALFLFIIAAIQHP